MSISLTHGGLPDGVTPFKLCDLVAEIASGTCKEERLSATAVRALIYGIAYERKGTDFWPPNCGYVECEKRARNTGRAWQRGGANFELNMSSLI